jgi:hypothetical protein
VKPWRHPDIPIWLLFLDPEDLGSLNLGQSGTLSKEQGSHDLEISLRGTKDLSKRPTCIGIGRARNH